MLADWNKLKVVVKKLNMGQETTLPGRAAFKRELTAWMYVTLALLLLLFL